MKKTTLLIIIILSAFTSNAQSSLNKLLCTSVSANTCGSLSQAYTDGTTFYTVWVVSSSSFDLTTGGSATITPTGSVTATFGTMTAYSLGSGNYALAWPTTVSANQGAPTTYSIPTELKLYTSSPFVPSLTTTYSIPTNAPLPVEFVNVRAFKMDGSNVIQWSTASEINNQLFVVESSIDGVNWTEVAMQNGAGNSQEILHYKVIDNSPISNSKVHYRVKQQDFDGVVDYSDVVTVNSGANDVVIYPNPIVGNEIMISGLDSENLDIKLTAQTGKEIAFELDLNSSKINVENLPAGIYFLSMNGKTTKLLKYNK